MKRRVSWNGGFAIAGSSRRLLPLSVGSFPATRPVIATHTPKGAPFQLEFKLRVPARKITYAPSHPNLWHYPRWLNQSPRVYGRIVGLAWSPGPTEGVRKRVQVVFDAYCRVSFEVGASRAWSSLPTRRGLGFLPSEDKSHISCTALLIPEVIVQKKFFLLSISFLSYRERDFL